MKTIALLVGTVLGAVLLTGCGDKPAETSSTAPAADRQPTASDEVKKAVSQAATEVAAEVKKQASAVYAEASKQLTESVRNGTDTLLKNIVADLEGRVAKLGEALKSNESLTQQLNTAVKAMAGGQDADAVGSLNKLSTASLTPEQTTLAKDVYNAAAAFVTQRNFASLEGMNSEVGQLVNAVWQGNYSSALAPLQKVYSQATLTPQQKELLGATFDPYLPAGWKDTAGKLQQGLDTLKKFGQ
jgi:NADH dehydrogenase/NADH:ubiquinone oxidoreductase subunit G